MSTADRTPQPSGTGDAFIDRSFAEARRHLMTALNLAAMMPNPHAQALADDIAETVLRLDQTMGRVGR